MYTPPLFEKRELIVGEDRQFSEIGVIDVTLYRCISQGTYCRIRCHHRTIDSLHGRSRHKRNIFRHTIQVSQL
jgi:hypothetical protein